MLTLADTDVPAVAAALDRYRAARSELEAQANVIALANRIAADRAAGRRPRRGHRFVRDGAWAMSALWRVPAVYAIGRFAPTGVVALDCDDTLFHKAGRQVNGAGVFRDAVRSTVRRIVYALGLNLAVATLRVTPPWGGPPIALPVNARLHKKKDTTTVEHAAAMIRELAGWLLDRDFHLCADGAYASLCGAGLPRNWAGSSSSTATTSTLRWTGPGAAPAPRTAPSRSAPSWSSTGHGLTRPAGASGERGGDRRGGLPRRAGPGPRRAAALPRRPDLAEEALQEALLTALERWPAAGVPDRPAAWLLTTARNRRWITCCHPALSQSAQVALTLRCLGGLTTQEIARVFLLPEPTLAQHLVRA